MTETMPAVKPVIILTRPAALNAAFAEAIAAAGIEAQILEAPVTRIEPVAAYEPPATATGAVFTSQNGVAFGPDGTGPAWCVGDKTAEVAAAKGWQAVSVSGDVDRLFQRICADLEGAFSRHALVHYCGQETRGALAERLTDVGILTERCVVYRQEPQVLSTEVMTRILDPNPAIFPVFSPKSAKRLIAQLPKDARVNFVAISQAVAEVIPPERIAQLEIAQSPNAQSLIAALRHML